jgi:hypothetical protein
MRGLLATLVLLLGALAMTGLLASGLQEKATAGRRRRFPARRRSR